MRHKYINAAVLSLVFAGCAKPEAPQPTEPTAPAQPVIQYKLVEIKPETKTKAPESGTATITVVEQQGATITAVESPKATIRAVEQPTAELRFLSTSFSYSYGDKFMKDPYAKITDEDFAYVDIPSNEFTVILTSAAYPQGKKITIDPDDMGLVKHPETQRVVLAPRHRFLSKINAEFPSTGVELPPVKAGDELGIEGTAPMFKHLTDSPQLKGHGINKDQIIEAMRKCHGIRNIPEPTVK